LRFWKRETGVIKIKFPIMLSFAPVKHPSENTLNVFASLLLGGVGIIILLLPNYLNADISSQSWQGMLFGAICFTTALLLQVISVMHVPKKQAKGIQGFSAFLLILCTVIYMRNRYAVEGIVPFTAAVAQIFLLFSSADRFKRINFTLLSLAMSGFPIGIYLAITQFDFLPSEYAGLIPSLAGVFLVTAFGSASALIAPTFKYRNFIIRLQIIPWLAWAFIFLPTIYGANFMVACIAVFTILFSDLIPWRLLSISRDDILTRRMLATGFVIELSLLIFLGGLLLVMDFLLNISFSSFTTVREAAFIFFGLVSAVVYYQIITIIITVNGLMQELAREDDEPDDDEQTPQEWYDTAWGGRLKRYIKPFMLTHENIRIRVNAQADRIQLLQRQVENEKKRNAQLTLLIELSQQLENQLDQPVAAQLAVNTLERAVNCSLACIFLHEPECGEFIILASAGRHTYLVPAGHRQETSKGVIGRAFRQRKTQIVNDVRQDPDYIKFRNEKNLSALVIPLIFNGHVNGVISIKNETTNAFSSIDIGLAEAVAAELTRAWERSGYHQRLMELVQTGSQLSAMVEPSGTAQEVAQIAQHILQARFIYVQIQLGQERNFVQSASAGNAPHLLTSLENAAVSESLMETTFKAEQPFRVRDVRKYPLTTRLNIDSAGLRSLLAIPIRWHQLSIGAIFAFGKQHEVFFSENDESLAKLLAIQTAGAFESTWLQQELRSSLRITSLLYRLSNQIIQAETLESAALDIAHTAHKLANNNVTGIVLLSPDGITIAEAGIDQNGMPSKVKHPANLIKDAMESGQMIYLSQGKAETRTCLPIQTPIRKYGALWMNTPDRTGGTGSKPAANPNDLQSLVNQAAIALERSLLLAESRRQAEEIKAAYDMLEATYDQTLASLSSALDARDRETEGHSLRVSQLAVKLGETLGFSQEQLKVLERGSLLHDIGKIGISDNILNKPGPLSEEEWQIMRQHPDIGAKIVEGIPFLEDTLPLIRHHQERWDGTGYPGKFVGEDIPLLARLFAVVDAFDALTSNRPYREKMPNVEALGYIRENAGILFDPHIAAAFEQMFESGNIVIPAYNET
jgi:putative nucleotidyltransferase with HDIG domain